MSPADSARLVTGIAGVLARHEVSLPQPDWSAHLAMVFTLELDRGEAVHLLSSALQERAGLTPAHSIAVALEICMAADGLDGVRLERCTECGARKEDPRAA